MGLMGCGLVVYLGFVVIWVLVVFGGVSGGLVGGFRGYGFAGFSGVGNFGGFRVFAVIW